MSLPAAGRRSDYVLEGAALSEKGLRHFSNRATIPPEADRQIARQRTGSTAPESGAAGAFAILPFTMDCAFCEIEIKKKQWVLAVRPHTLVIFSNPRLMEGHLLVIPKRHAEKMSELYEPERDELIATVIEFQEKILKHVAPGCDVRHHYRPFIPDNDLKVSHLHMHLHPRTFGDELYEQVEKRTRDVFAPLSSEEYNRIAALLK